MENVKSVIKVCDICGSNATSLCFQCLQYFCESCYNLIHNKLKNSKHEKNLIDPFFPIDLKCPKHPKDSLSLFCLDEKGKYICNNIL